MRPHSRFSIFAGSLTLLLSLSMTSTLGTDAQQSAEGASSEQGLTPSQQAMLKVLGEHAKAELTDMDLDATMATMAENPYIILVASATGGDDHQGVREFYRGMMAGQLPQDLKMTSISTTIGSAQLVSEFILSFTHDVAMDWLLPGVPPTGKRVEVPMVVAFSFRDGNLASERIYCDQASMLVQIGVLDPGDLPIAGLEGVRKLRQLTGIGQETD